MKSRAPPAGAMIAVVGACVHMCEQELIYDGEEAISSVNRFCELMRFEKESWHSVKIHRQSEGAQSWGQIASIGTAFDFEIVSVDFTEEGK